jgi:hypothetical protein
LPDTITAKFAPDTKRSENGNRISPFLTIPQVLFVQSKVVAGRGADHKRGDDSDLGGMDCVICPVTDKAQQDAVIDASIKAAYLDPTAPTSLRTIAEMLPAWIKADHKRVGRRLERLEATGALPQLERTLGLDGKQRRFRRMYPLAIPEDFTPRCQLIAGERHGTCWINIGDTQRHGDSLLIPHHLVIALHETGWLIRSEIIIERSNPEPRRQEPFQRTHEMLLLLAKCRGHYWEPTARNSVWRIPHDGRSVGIELSDYYLSVARRQLQAGSLAATIWTRMGRTRMHRQNRSRVADVGKRDGLHNQ